MKNLTTGALFLLVLTGLLYQQNEISSVKQLLETADPVLVEDPPEKTKSQDQPESAKLLIPVGYERSEFLSADVMQPDIRPSQDFDGEPEIRYDSKIGEMNPTSSEYLSPDDDIQGSTVAPVSIGNFIDIE